MTQTLTNSAKRGIGSRIWTALTQMGENHPGLRAAQTMMNMSDEELSARGIRREEIGQHAFKGYFYS